MDLVKMRQAIGEGRFEWRRHALERMVERGIAQSAALSVVMEGEVIEENPNATPYPSALLYGIVRQGPLHVVVAFDEMNVWAYIITVYVPDLAHFEKDLKTRRTT